MEDLPKPKNSKGDRGYRDSKHATTAEQMYDEEGLIPEEDWELLTGGKYGRRIEVDNVIAYAGAERFWNEFILPSFKELFDTADYNLSLRKVVYVTLSNLGQLNTLAQNAGTISAAETYDISTKGFIVDIDAVEEENKKRIENSQLKNKDIRWLEEQLASLSKEFSKRTGIKILEWEGEKEENDRDDSNVDTDGMDVDKDSVNDDDCANVDEVEEDSDEEEDYEEE